MYDQEHNDRYRQPNGKKTPHVDRIVSHEITPFPRGTAHDLTERYILYPYGSNTCAKQFKDDIKYNISITYTVFFNQFIGWRLLCPKHRCGQIGTPDAIGPGVGT